MRIRNARTDIWADESLRKVKPTAQIDRVISGWCKMKIEATGPDDDPMSIVEQCDDATFALDNPILSEEQGMGLLIGKLKSLERYEKVALSKRNRALRSLDDDSERLAIG